MITRTFPKVIRRREIVYTVTWESDMGGIHPGVIK